MTRRLFFLRTLGALAIFPILRLASPPRPKGPTSEQIAAVARITREWNERHKGKSWREFPPEGETFTVDAKTFDLVEGYFDAKRSLAYIEPTAPYPNLKFKVGTMLRGAA